LTGVTVIEMVSVSLSASSLLLMVRVAAPLKSAVGVNLKPTGVPPTVVASAVLMSEVLPLKGHRRIVGAVAHREGEASRAGQRERAVAHAQRDGKRGVVDIGHREHSAGADEHQRRVFIGALRERHGVHRRVVDRAMVTVKVSCTEAPEASVAVMVMVAVPKASAR
jgi:hypothetical protein